MRTYGRSGGDSNNPGPWVVIETDVNGLNDMVWLTTLIQCLLLFLGESPFYANYGIPAKQSVVQQVFPDFYVLQTQSQFAQYFAALLVNRLPGNTPAYDIKVTTNQGAKITASIT